MKRKLETRPINKLKAHPHQGEFFQELSEPELQALAWDIHQNGLVSPIEILPDGTIVCGHQRVRAYVSLKKTEIECWIRDDLAEKGEAAVEDRFLADNANRRQMSGLELARVYVRRKELANKSGCGGDVREALGKFFGKSGRTLDRLARILRTPIEVQRAFDKGKLTLHEAGRVADFSAENRDQLVKSIQAGTAPREAFKQLLTRLGKSQDQGVSFVETIQAQLQRIATLADRSLAAKSQQPQAFDEAAQLAEAIAATLLRQKKAWAKNRQAFAESLNSPA